ncbi:MAG: helix-turn-helix domain-containing protein [Timaviella obliquedivisa GSE-PSE-MK23-08B]|jgi:DNA-binding transcriptional regulator YiaG|nr:helix-turn-helix domain-containing protein [Timaviella obliquedivisa GSE-PSE-MK23-08B]
MSKVKTLDIDTNALIRPLRELCGLTQGQFAARLGVTVVTVNRWENYRAKPMPLALQQVKVLLIEMNQSENDTDQAIAHLLLEQYFPKKP